MTLVIADDEPRIRRGLARVDWPSLGFSLLGTAWSGRSALQLMERSGEPSVLLTDVRMPDGDGIWLARELRQRQEGSGRWTQIVFLSAYSDLEYIQSAFELHAAQYLTKPVDQEQLELLFRRIGDNRKLYEPAPEVASQLNNAGGWEEGPETIRTTSTPKAEEAARMIAQSYSDPQFSVSQAAESLGIHPNYLSTIFTQRFGEPFNTRLEKTRIEHACALLWDTTLSVGDIARQVGYRDPRYFSVRFRSRKGRSPRTYRDDATKDPELER